MLTGLVQDIALHSSVEPGRIRPLNGHDVIPGSFILYWMKNAHRSVMNPSLNLAVDLAGAMKLPVAVFFFAGGFTGRTIRQNTFMLEGLRDVHESLAKKKIPFYMIPHEPLTGLKKFCGASAAIITDAGYFRDERLLEDEAAASARCAMLAVESNVTVPLNSLPAKEQYSAATLRPVLGRLLPLYLNSLPDPKPRHQRELPELSEAATMTRPDHDMLPVSDTSVGPVNGKRGGYRAAKKLLADFVKHKLGAYATDRNDPDLDATSMLSPYLHFGQVSPVEVALSVLESAGETESAASFLDELIVRRELGFNLVRYNDNHGSIACVPSWARDSLMSRAGRGREYIYTLDEFEKSLTHDIYWNAAQNQLVRDGIIHNYMRMYWGKKIIEWTESPADAYAFMVYLNNRYALDGNDPDSYAGIAWCFGKHDRPWGERPVFGKVRYMNSSGLRRKFSMKLYMERYGI